MSKLQSRAGCPALRQAGGPPLQVWGLFGFPHKDNLLRFREAFWIDLTLVTMPTNLITEHKKSELRCREGERFFTMRRARVLGPLSRASLYVLGLALVGCCGIGSIALGQLPKVELPAVTTDKTTGQNPSPGETQVPAETGPSLETKLAEARANLAAAEALGDRALTNAPPGVSLQDV